MKQGWLPSEAGPFCWLLSAVTESSHPQYLLESSQEWAVHSRTFQSILNVLICPN
jgi:hypothetical protein